MAAIASIWPPPARALRRPGLLGYPLHPPKQPEQLRVAHLPSLTADADPARRARRVRLARGAAPALSAAVNRGAARWRSFEPEAWPEAQARAADFILALTRTRQASPAATRTTSPRPGVGPPVARDDAVPSIHRRPVVVVTTSDLGCGLMQASTRNRRTGARRGCAICRGPSRTTARQPGRRRRGRRAGQQTWMLLRSGSLGGDGGQRAVGVEQRGSAHTADEEDLGAPRRPGSV